MSRKSIFYTMICAFCIVFLSSCGEDTRQSEQVQEKSWQEQYDLGIQSFSEGNCEDAIAAFTAAIEIDSKQALIYEGRGDAYIGSGETEENLISAQADYEQAIELDKTNANAYLGLADVYIRQGDFDRALEILREGLEKAGGNQTIANKIAEIEAGNIADSSGAIRRLNGYNSNGELAWYHIFDYNEAGQQISVTAYNAAGNQTGYMELLYNEEGRPLNRYSSVTETGELDGYTKYEYDDRGNMVKSEYSKLGEEPNQYEVYEYSVDGICTGSSRYQLYYGPEGPIANSWHLTDSSEYNTRGEPIKTTWYDDGNIIGYYTYEYDSDGKRIRMNNCDADGTILEYHISLYDDNGNFIGQEIYNADGSLRFSTARGSN